MARGGNYKSLPNNIYYVEDAHGYYYGPYTKKPTKIHREEGGEIIHFRYNEKNLNYEKVLTVKENRDKKIGELVDKN